MTEVEWSDGIGERGWRTADGRRRHQRPYGTDGGELDDAPDGTGRFDGRRGAFATESLHRKVDGIRVVVRAGVVRIERKGRFGIVLVVVIVVIVVVRFTVVMVMLVSVVGRTADVDVGSEVMTGRGVVAVRVAERRRLTQQQPRQQQQ